MRGSIPQDKPLESLQVGRSSPKVGGSGNRGGADGGSEIRDELSTRSLSLLHLRLEVTGDT